MYGRTTASLGPLLLENTLNAIKMVALLEVKSHLGQIVLWTSEGRPHLLNITITTGRRKQGYRHGIKEGTLTSPRIPTYQKEGGMVKLGEIDDFHTIRSKIGQF